MKHILFLMFLCLSNPLFSQEDRCGTIQYTESFSTGSSFEYELYFNVKETLYLMLPPAKNQEYIQTVNGFMPEMILPVIYYNQGQNELISQEDVAFEKVIVKENHCNLEWKLSQKEKQIGNFHCLQASITLRGVAYIAWYTPDIPIPFGPWKFRGLPGLVLEVYDEDRNFAIQMNEFVYPTSCELMNTKIAENPLEKPIEWEAYIKLRKTEAEDLERLFNSKLDRGSSDVGVTIEGFQKEKYFEK